MELRGIIAIAQNGVIGKEGTLPWKISSDLKWFKENTQGHCMIMGRKNYEDIGRPLPGRYTIILSRSADYQPDLKGMGEVVHTPGEALAVCRRQNDSSPYVIGGAEIYKLFAPQIKHWVVTEVQCNIEGDVVLNPLPWQNWTSKTHAEHPKSDRDEYPFTFKTFKQ